MSNAEARELRHENDYTYNMNVSELESYEENLLLQTGEEETEEEEFAEPIEE